MNEQVETAGRTALRTGRVMGGLVCLAFLLAGLLFGWLIGSEAWADLQTQLWKPVPCTILQSDSPEPSPAARGSYSIRIRFEYLWNDTRHTSDRLHRRSRNFDDYQDIQRLLDRYRPGMAAVCRVNPKLPSEAVLEKSTPWIALALVLPLVFTIVGVVGLYAAVSGSTRHARSSSSAGPISSRSTGRSANPAARPGCLLLFSLIFLAAGSSILHLAFIRPQLQIMAAARWEQVPCTVLSSAVKSHHSKGGTTYSVEILYEYQIGGRPYRSNRYSFFKIATSGRDDKEAVIRAFPPGSERVCYVNPADPTDAVLDRNATGWRWLGLLPAVFVAIGIGGIVRAWRGRRGAGMAAGGRDVADRPAGAGDDPPLVLRPTKRRLGNLMAALLFGTFWNGIVSVFVVQFIRDVHRGHIDWFMALFLTPFVVVGLVFVGLLGYQLLALFAPRPTVTLGSSTIRLGEPVEVQWRFSGGAHVIETLRVYLEGAEEARYQRGTSTATDRNVFARIEIADTGNAGEVRAGQAWLTVPANTSPSWSSANNSITWTLRIKGVIHLYPDVDDAFPIVVVPARAEAAAPPSPHP